MADLSGARFEPVRRKILFLAQLPPPVHGVTVVSARVHAHLQNAGYDVVQRWDGGARSLGDIGTKSLGKLWSLVLLTTGLVTEAAIGRRYDAAYVTLTPWSHAALRDAGLAWLAHSLSRRVLVHLHTEGLAELVAGRDLRARLLRRLLKGSELIAITAEARTVAERSGLFRAVHRVENTAEDPGDGVRPWMSEATHTDGAHADAAQGAVDAPGRDRPLRLAYLGNFDKRKGILDVVWLTGALARDGVSVECVLAGAPSRLLSEAEVRDAITEAGVDDHVSLAGFVDAAARTRILSQADLFIYPTRHDHAPLVLLEAMAHGAVPLALDAGGVRSMMGPALENNVFSHLERENEVRTWLYARTQAYLAAPDRIGRDGRTAREIWRARFSPAAFEASVIGVFSQAPATAGASAQAQPDGRAAEI